MKLKVSILTLFLAHFTFSQIFSKCKVFLNEGGLNTLSNLGIPVDHGSYKKNSFFISDFSDREIEIMKSNGFKVELLIKDVSKYYENRAFENSLKRNANCSQNSIDSQIVPSNFNLGSMGGYYTYAEFLAEIDQMHQLYPDLITIKAPIDNFLTHEGRPIYWLKISDQAAVDEPEQEVLYSSIHHAREPASLSSTIFYMWYLLENYANNPEIQYLVNETEMYFVPMLNPDGYVQNETSNPNGGGMWRKNKRNNLDGTFGVDLNRNYSYQWGTTGIDMNTNSDVYPGDSAFSEPETQAMKWFCENRDFLLAFNAHTYSNLLLFPIGSTTSEFAQDHDYFLALGSHMVQYNGFIAQKSSVLYPASGDSDDYMYKMDLVEKPKILAYTPEIGSDADGFWPASINIIPISQGMVFANLVLAHAAHNYWEIKDIDPNTILTTTGDFHFSLNRLGLIDAAVNVSIEPLLGIQSVGNGSNYSEIQNNLINGQISYVLNSGIQVGDEIKYVLTSDFGGYIKRDTISKTFGNPTIQFADNADNNQNWTGAWNISTSEFYSPSSSLTDSPNGDYLNNSTNNYQFNQIIDLTAATNAKIEFYAKWAIEENYDYARLEISTDNGQTWVGQCGKYTNPGVGGNGGAQVEGEPVYDGFQLDWVLEEISLNDYLGDLIKIRFVMKADGGVKEDGFYFDDFKILYDVANVGLKKIENQFKIFPNPAKDELLISNYTGKEIQSLAILDLNGKVILEQIIPQSMNNFTLNIQSLENGMYFVQLEQNGNKERIKICVAK